MTELQTITWILLGCLKQNFVIVMIITQNQWRTQEFFSGGGEVQQIQLTTEDGDLGVVAP